MTGQRTAWTRLRSALRPHASRGNLLPGLLCALLGFAVVVQVRSTQDAGLDGLRQSDLVRILDDVTERSDRLRTEARDLEETRARVTNGSTGSRAALEEAQARARVLGIVAGIFLEPTVPTWLQPYLPIAVVAALDAVFGGLRALLDGIFDDRVFVVSFVANVLVAALIVYLGDQLGVGSQLSTGVVVVLGIRIFSNAAAIRRQLFRA